MLSTELLKDVDVFLEGYASGTYKLNSGKLVKGVPFSVLSSELRATRWKSLGSQFYRKLCESGYRVEPGEGTVPRQRKSSEVVFKP